MSFSTFQFQRYLYLAQYLSSKVARALNCNKQIISINSITNQNNLHLNHTSISDIMRSETFRLIMSISKWNKERKGGWRMDVDIDDTDSELESGVTDEEN